MLSVKKDKLAALVASSYTKTDVLRGLGWCMNGSQLAKVGRLIEHYQLDTSHFDRYHYHKRYDIVERECPVCGAMFEVKSGGKTSKQVTCSYACSNTYFRSGKDNPNYRNGGSIHTYRNIIDETSHCIDCDENRRYLLRVHHIDGNRRNNKRDNLEIVCPTHHVLRHLRFSKRLDRWVLSWKNLTPREMLSKL